MKKYFLRAIVVVLGIVVGCVVGGYFTIHRYSKRYAIVRAFAWTGIASAVSINEYDQNTSDARTGLLLSLKLLSSGVESSVVDPTLKNALRMHRGVTEARLYILENDGGNADNARFYLSKAQEDLKTTGWIDVSEQKIRQVVERRQERRTNGNP